ncbi:MAG: hypothetical protein R3301_05285 [Saprospiraceae bacterium]|nr:hypothetical protein [Saprospiraceae bacterium]
MSHELSHKQVPLPGLKPRHRIKDSLLVVIVFLIGLIGTCYILHFALSQQSSSGFHMDHPDGAGEAEAIYVTTTAQ